MTGPCGRLLFDSVVEKTFQDRRSRRGRWRRKVVDDSGSSHFCFEHGVVGFAL